MRRAIGKHLRDFIAIVALMVLVVALGVFLPMWDISSVAFKKMGGA